MVHFIKVPLSPMLVVNREKFHAGSDPMVAAR